MMPQSEGEIRCTVAIKNRINGKYFEGLLMVPECKVKDRSGRFVSRCKWGNVTFCVREASVELPLMKNASEEDRRRAKQPVLFVDLETGSLPESASLEQVLAGLGMKEQDFRVMR